MARTIGAFTFEELDRESGRGRVGYTNDGESNIAYKIAWTDLAAFIGSLKGGWRKINDTTFNYVAPDQHPDFTAFYCAECAWDHLGISTRTGTTSSWEFAKVTASYKPLTFNSTTGTPDTIVTEDIDLSLDTDTHDAGSYQCDIDSTLVPTPVSKVHPTCTYTLTYMSLPALPGGNFSQIFGLLGKVNNAAFKGAGAGQMIFLGATASRNTTIYGEQNWKIGYKFQVRAKDWNKVFVPLKGDYVAVSAVTGGNKIYDAGDFSTLLPKS